MSQNEVVGIDIVARLDDFRSELAKIKDIGGKEARALTAQLSREIKKSEKASKRAAEQSKKTAAAYKAQGKAAKKAASETGDLSKAFGSTAKKAAALFLTIEMGKKAFSAVAGAVAEVVEQDKQIERFKGQWGEMRDAVLLPLSATVVGLASSTATMMDEFGRSETFSTLKSNVDTTFRETVIPAITGSVLAGRKFVAILSGMGEALSQVSTIGGAFKAVVSSIFDDSSDSYSRASSAVDDAKAAFVALGEIPSTIEADFNHLTDSMGEFTDEAVRNSKAVRQNAEEATQQAAAVKASAAGIISARQKERESYIASANERQAMADRAIADEERAAAAQKKAITEVAAARDAAAEQERSLRTSLATTAIETASNVASSIIDGLQNVLLANVQEAKKRRDIELGLAILRGELQAAAAFGTTLATYGGTPQGFALAAAAAAAVGISSKAAAGAAHAGSAEKFHSGGLARDESTAVLRAGEGILTPAAVSAVGGERGLQDLNAGASAMGDNGARTLQIGARAFDALVSQSLTSRGSVLTRSLASLRARPGGYKVHG